MSANTTFKNICMENVSHCKIIAKVIIFNFTLGVINVCGF